MAHPPRVATPQLPHTHRTAEVGFVGLAFEEDVDVIWHDAVCKDVKRLLGEERHDPHRHLLRVVGFGEVRCAAKRA